MVEILRCAERRGLEVLSLYDFLAALAVDEPDRYRRLFMGHFSPSGNEFVAEQLASHIAELGVLKVRR